MAVHKEAVALINESFENGLDCGTIPGTSKPTLLKPGAEKLCTAFGAAVKIEVLPTSEVNHEIEFSYKTKWKSGTALGLYRYVVRTSLFSKVTGEFWGEGIGSCSTLESKYCDRPRDCENTVLKMAKKRALVDAALTVFGLSNRFTQDVEDLVVEPQESRTNRASPSSQSNRPVQSQKVAAHQGTNASSASEGSAYNPDDARMADKLGLALEKRDIPPQFHKTISELMRGKKMGELADVIKEAKLVDGAFGG